MPVTNVVRLICPNLKCRSVLSVPATARGKTVRCRQCGMRVHVPNTAAAGAPGSGTPGAPGTSDAAETTVE